MSELHRQQANLYQNLKSNFLDKHSNFTNDEQSGLIGTPGECNETRDFMISFWFNSNPITSGKSTHEKSQCLRNHNRQSRLALNSVPKRFREKGKYIWTSITLMWGHLSCYILSFLHFDGFKCTKKEAEKILNYFGFFLVPRGENLQSYGWLIASHSEPFIIRYLERAFESFYLFSFLGDLFVFPEHMKNEKALLSQKAAHV